MLPDALGGHSSPSGRATILARERSSCVASLICGCSQMVLGRCRTLLTASMKLFCSRLTSFEKPATQGLCPKPSGITFGDHTFRKCLHFQTRKPKLGEAREALNDHAHRRIDIQLRAVSHVELGEWQLPHACKTQGHTEAFALQMTEGATHFLGGTGAWCRL